MEKVATLAEGAFLALVIVFLILTIKKGVPWAVAKLKAWWAAGKADLAQAKTDIAGLKADVAALKTKVGL